MGTSVSGGWVGLPDQPRTPLNLRPLSVSVGRTENFLTGPPRRQVDGTSVWPLPTRDCRLQLGQFVESQRPRRCRGRGGALSNLDGGEAVDLGTRVEVRALFDDGAGADQGPGADHAAVADDRTRLNNGAGADAAAVDHGTGA